MSSNSSSSCLVLTFSSNAASEMRERIHSSGSSMHGLEVLTFHGYGFKVIKLYFDRLGYRSTPVLCSKKNARKILTSIRGGPPSASSSSKAGSSDEATRRKEVTDTLKLFKAAKKTGNPIEYLYQMQHPALISIFKMFQGKLIEGGFIEFGDMVPMAVHLLSKYDDISNMERLKAHYCFCDEFQDTNGPQLKLLTTIAAEGRVTIVGDTNQLIFGFQGADRNNFKDFENFYNAKSKGTADSNINSNSSSSSICSKSKNNNNSIQTLPHTTTFSAVNKVRLRINYRSCHSVVGVSVLL